MALRFNPFDIRTRLHWSLEPVNCNQGNIWSSQIFIKATDANSAANMFGMTCIVTHIGEDVFSFYMSECKPKSRRKSKLLPGYKYGLCPRLLSSAGYMLCNEASDVLNFFGINAMPQSLICFEVYWTSSCLQALKAFLPIRILHLQ